MGYWDIRPQLEMVSLVPTQQWSLVVYKWKGYGMVSSDISGRNNVIYVSIGQYEEQRHW